MKDLKQSLSHHYMVLANANQIDIAQYQLDEKIKENPQEAKYWRVRGNLYYQQGLLDKALFCFDQAACLEPSDLESILSGAVVLADSGFYPAAKKRFETAEQLSIHKTSLPLEKVTPDQLGVFVLDSLAKDYLNLARTLQSLGLEQQAQNLIDQALKEFKSWHLFLEKASYLLKDKKFSQAIENLNLAREHTRDSREKAATTFLMAAFTLIGKGDWKQAKNEYDQALQLLGTDHPRLLIFLSHLFDQEEEN